MRNDPNKVLRTSTSTTLNARDFTMVLADATAGPVALVLISPAGLSEWSIKVANIGSGDDVTLSVAGGSFSFTLPAGAACEVSQDDLGVLHVFGSTNGSIPSVVNYEIPTGAVDGVNDEFTFTAPPILVHRNGVMERRLGTILGNVFTFTTPPDIGDDIEGLI